jgi:hypothetical protein
MALVQLSDVIIPSVFLSYQDVINPKLTAIFESGIVTQDPILRAALDSDTGLEVTVPAWGDLDRTIEPNYQTDNPADVAVPLKLGTLEWKMRKAFLDQAWSAANLVRELAGTDPMAAIRARTDRYWQRRWQSRLLATVLGVYNANVAQNSADMVVNIAAGAAVAPTTANQFARNAFVDANFTLGEHFGDVAALMVHPTVLSNMIKNELITYVQPSQVPIKMPYFDEKLVIVDEDMPFFPATGSGGTLVAARYLSILFAQGAIGYAAGTTQVPVEIYRQPLQGNGGGVDILIERKSMMMHPAGYNFVGGTVSVGVNATNADLQVAANWARVEYRENVKLAFMVTNG